MGDPPGPATLGRFVVGAASVVGSSGSSLTIPVSSSWVSVSGNGFKSFPKSAEGGAFETRLAEGDGAEDGPAVSVDPTPNRFTPRFTSRASFLSSSSSSSSCRASPPGRYSSSRGSSPSSSSSSSPRPSSPTGALHPSPNATELFSTVKPNPPRLPCRVRAGALAAEVVGGFGAADALSTSLPNPNAAKLTPGRSSRGSDFTTAVSSSRRNSSCGYSVWSSPGAGSAGR